MASIRRGEVFLVNFDPTVGSEAKKTRPAVVVSNDINNAHSPIVSISPITSVTSISPLPIAVRGTRGSFRTGHCTARKPRPVQDRGDR